MFKNRVPHPLHSQLIQSLHPVFPTFIPLQILFRIFPTHTRIMRPVITFTPVAMDMIIPPSNVLTNLISLVLSGILLTCEINHTTPVMPFSVVSYNQSQTSYHQPTNQGPAARQLLSKLYFPKVHQCKKWNLALWWPKLAKSRWWCHNHHGYQPNAGLWLAGA